MERRIKLFVLLPLMLLAASCDLTEYQQATADRKMIFGSEAGMRTYCYNFYVNILPDNTDAFAPSTVDLAAKATTSTFEQGAYSADVETSWSWSQVRNVNYFIYYNTDPDVPENIRNNYTGVARFFRAWLYYSLLRKYGEVPWIGVPLNPDSPELYAPRDSRDVIITHMLEDLDFAFEHIIASDIQPNANTINKWTAMALKSRVALFEASFRKYHAGSEFVKNCTITPDELYREAAAAAKTVMDGKVYSIWTGTPYKEGRGAYRDLFTSDDAVTQEVMLSAGCSPKLSAKLGYQNFWYNSPTYGSRLSMTRTMVNTYLNIDGSFYTDVDARGNHKSFEEETTGRDLRLNQTIRAADYTCINAKKVLVPTAPNVSGLCLTGYQITKYVLDDVAYDGGQNNINDIPIMRYAEVLLNYAEAKAELGEITDADWSATIGVLRRRAGITGGDLDALPTASDAFMKALYPSVTSPVILEIRRERECELAYENFRFTDIRRWGVGDLWQRVKWDGIFIPALDTPMDLNGDGTFDAYFTLDADYLATGEYNYISVLVLPDSSPENGLHIEDTTDGYFLRYDVPRVWTDKMYLYPVPSQERILNPNLTQNPGW